VLELRPFQPEDFGLLLDLANEAVPFAPTENAEWLEYRKAFDESQRFRRHYLAVDNNRALGYGGLEQQSDDPKSLRIYIVCGSQNLDTVGTMLYNQLIQDAQAVRATTLWARELQADESAFKFFTGKGFAETQRLTPPNFAPVVVFQLAL